MFADSFCDSGWSNQAHRGWTTLISFAVQSLAIACLLLLPLIYTQGLPKLAVLAPLMAPAPPPAIRPAQSRAMSSSVAPSNMAGTRLVSPPEIPRSIATLVETAPPPADTVGVGVAHGIGDSRGTVFGAITGSDSV